MADTPKILFVLSSHDKLLTGKPTGWFLPEAAHPYSVLTSAGFQVDFASPKGAAAPLDPWSVEQSENDEVAMKFHESAETQKLVGETLVLGECKEEDYKALFYVGGHGPCFDLAVDPVSIALSERFFAAGKPLAAVCHGPVAFHKVKDPSTGESIYNGRKATCFSNEEEEAVGLTEAIPFLVETDMRDQGAIFVNERKPWGEEVVVDKTGGIFITGANPASAGATAEAILKALAEEK